MSCKWRRHAASEARLPAQRAAGVGAGGAAAPSRAENVGDVSRQMVQFYGISIASLDMNLIMAIAQVMLPPTEIFTNNK